jgi:hypothetical protein
MKKSVVAVAAVLLAASALPAMALEAKFSGEFRTRGEYFNEHFMEEDFYTDVLGLSESEADKESSLWDSRMRLRMDFAANENLKGVYVLEVGDVTWGGTATNAGVTLADRAVGIFGDGRTRDDGNGGGNLGADAANLETKNMYIDFTVPNTPVNTKVGILPLKLGHGIVLDNDATALVVQAKVDPVTIGACTFKTREGDIQEDDDIDYYGLFVSAALQDAGSVGLFGIYGHDEIGEGADDIGNSARNQVYNSALFANSKINEWWLGITADLKVDPLVIAFEADTYQAKVESHDSDEEINLDGYAAYLNVGVNLPVVKAGVAGLYATGRFDEAGEGKGGDAFSPLSPTDPQNKTLLDWDNMFMVDIKQNILTNLISAKVYAEVSPVEVVSVGVSGQGYWLADNPTGDEKGEGSYMGTEFDLNVNVQIYENLAYKVAGAYMMTSDEVFGIESTDIDSENIWFLGHQLIYTF